MKDLETGRITAVKAPAILGRGAAADIRIDDRSVSRRHARIAEASGLYYVEDLGSANGTFVNGRAVKDKTYLSDGDILQLGARRYACLIEGAQEETTRETVILRSVPALEEPELDSLRLSFLLDLTKGMARKQGLEELARDFFQGLSRIMEFDRGLLLLLDDANRLCPVYPSQEGELPISRTIAEKVLTSAEALLLQDAMSDQELGAQESIVALRVRSALCVPVTSEEKVLGIIYLDQPVAGGFSSKDMDLVRACASILGPLAENVRLRQRLEKAYNRTRKELAAAQASLLNMERRAVFARLAQAVAHEIRNPVMIAGGLLQRMHPRDEKDAKRLSGALEALKRVDRVLREVDSFVSSPEPARFLVKIADLLRDFVSNSAGSYSRIRLQLHLEGDVEHLLVSLDSRRMSKALDLIFSDMDSRSSSEVVIPVSLLPAGRSVAILIGDPAGRRELKDPFSPEVDQRPWRFGLFLNMASKIVADHQGRIRLNPEDPLSLPIEITLPLGQD